MTSSAPRRNIIDAVRKAGLRPRDTHDLSSVRMMTSTGSPLAPENFDFVYDAIKPDMHLASISGGTDIVSCFVLGVPTKPVWRGEIQGPGLGMAVDVFDEDGQAGARREGRARLHAAVPVDAGHVLERSRTARNTAPPISSAFPASGRMATSPNGRRMAASSSTAAPTRRSIPAACASARRRSTRRSRACRRCWRRSPSARIWTTTCASCCSCGWRRASRSTTRSSRRSRRRSAPAPRRATCRRRSSRSPTSRARSPARSPSSRCATSCMGATVKNKEALANPEALELYPRICRSSLRT